MCVNRILPKKICLEEHGGNYQSYIDAVYEVFHKDFIRNKTSFGTHKLNLKFNPLFQEKAYTFYHMTHEGKDETDRIPDMRRCECMPWTKPTIENTTQWDLKFWRQNRKNSPNRVCIWLDSEEDTDYFVVLEVRATYVLLWTAYVSTYTHETRKKEIECIEWEKSVRNKKYTPDELINEIQESILKKQGSLPTP